MGAPGWVPHTEGCESRAGADHLPPVARVRPDAMAIHRKRRGDQHGNAVFVGVLQ